ncbi:bifunctional RNase H/acid phosphatase [Actinopolymorpha singaporensis]|uniref:Probable phosphoglycerate mutase n=1 Tax=Actinopolymorpha singaporensis TaxID=117157 RepID=A0A1H1W7N0_9ACTN|nr:bifunctional RNase H/acid phosphatase [Actinopolymorpha singaporensis]SDS92476.1 probable phosphoglycerate mutase [Actinopolymorpha singaporensis]
MSDRLFEHSSQGVSRGLSAGSPGSGRRLVVEADGGSRGNPGRAAYGAVVRDAESGDVLARAAERIGTATNNVAEYNGLIAGLRLARELDAAAHVEIRMDSKLVIEQMAGRWKVKHADMRRLAEQARALVPANPTWTWVPRERNKTADALLNAVLDGGPPVWEVGASASTPVAADPTGRPAEETAPAEASAPARGWGAEVGGATTLLLLRHGETERSQAKRFSGSGGEDVSLTERGRAQAAAAARSLADRLGVAAVVSSPLRRTRQTAEVVAATLGLPVEVEPGLAETAFGEWDGFTFAEVGQRWPAELQAWLADTSVAPPGGESFEQVLIRVRAARDRLIRTYGGKTVVVVTHVTPIKLLTCLALDVPARAAYRMELPPAALTEVAWFADGAASLRSFGVPAEVPEDGEPIHG